MTGLDILNIMLWNRASIYINYMRVAGKLDDVIMRITEMETYIRNNHLEKETLTAYLETVPFPEVSNEVYVLLGLR